METRSLEELQDLLDQKRIELAYITEFASYIKNANKIDQAIRDREIFKNSGAEKTENYVKLMRKLFDEKGRLLNSVSEGWTVDVGRANAKTLELKFLNNKNFSAAEIIIIESIDSSVVNSLVQANQKYLQPSIEDDDKDADMKINRMNSIFTNARKSLLLNSINEKIFKFEDGELRTAAEANTKGNFSFNFYKAKNRYEDEVRNLESAISPEKQFDELYKSLLKAANKVAHKNDDIGKLWDKLESIEKNPNLNKIEAMKNAIIEHYVALKPLSIKKENSLFKSNSLNGELKRFMKNKLQMSKEEISKRSEQYERRAANQSKVLPRKA